MTPKKSVVRWKTALVAAGVAAVALLSTSSRTVSAQTSNATALSYADQLIQEGRKTFRFDTFGDEAFWGDRCSCTRPSPARRTAASAPASARRPRSRSASRSTSTRCRRRWCSRSSRARSTSTIRPRPSRCSSSTRSSASRRSSTTERRLKSMGIQCALCHSTVDDSFAPGIGQRLDGWANRDLNVGAIVALAPNLKPFTDLLGVDEATVRTVLAELGAGQVRRRADPRRQGLPPRRQVGGDADPAGVRSGRASTCTPGPGWGSVPHWNAFVANLEMHGTGDVLRSAARTMPAVPDRRARAGSATCASDADLITPKLRGAALLPAGACPRRRRRRAASTRRRPRAARRCSTGKRRLRAAATCRRCSPSRAGTCTRRARSASTTSRPSARPTTRYRTAPLEGLWTHQKGGFYHDGRFATLRDVVDHYATVFGLTRSPPRRRSSWNT